MSLFRLDASILPGTLVGVNPGLADFKDLAAALHSDALAAARDAGKALAAGQPA